MTNLSGSRKVVTVLGARPQFIKASVVSRAFSESDIAEVVVHTGQHFDENMSDVFFHELGMKPPARSLHIHGGGHGAMTGRMLAEIEGVLLTERPDAVLVYGDTNSTLAGALAAVKLHMPVAHVEAGLRSFNMRMPEEVNRVVTDRISSWLFTPTEAAVANLKREGVEAGRIFPVGDVMYDVALHHGRRARALSSVLSRHGLVAGEYILVTVHRAENTDDAERLRVIADALRELSSQTTVVLPLHPRTHAALARNALLEPLRNAVTITDPAGYIDMVQLEQNASVIATDSGGVQKEAFFHSVPCVTLREETEWVELVESGWNQLAPLGDAAALCDCILSARGRKGLDVAPYGHGDAAGRIVEALDSVL